MLIPFGVFSAAGAGGGGAAGDYELIETTVLGSAQASITFSSGGVWSAYKHLQVRAAVVSANSDRIFKYYYNGTTNVYRVHGLEGNGSNVSSYATNANEPYLNAGYIPTGSTYPHASVIDILDFNSTTKNTTSRSLSGNTQSGGSRIVLESGLWPDTSAVTSITFLMNGGNLATGTRISIYGIKGA